jgi:trehalose synthase
VRERFLLTRLIADELLLYTSVLGSDPTETQRLPIGPVGEERDPVCGMRVNAATARHLAYDHHALYFCSRTCEDEFARDPARFLRAVGVLPQVRRARRWLRRHRDHPH